MILRSLQKTNHFASPKKFEGPRLARIAPDRLLVMELLEIS